MWFKFNKALPLLIALILILIPFAYNGCSAPVTPSVDPGFRGVGFQHTSDIKQCATCHEGKRPLVNVGTPSFDHTNPVYGGNADCFECHKHNMGSSWTTGQFAHDPQPTTCLSCHVSERPAGLVGTSNFNHALNGTGDCVGCHNSVTQYNSINDWKNTGLVTPNSLIGTKTKNVPVGIPTFTSTTISTITNQTQAIKLQMLHSSFEVPSVMMANCTTCHAGANSGNYAGGIFHAALTTSGQPQPATCVDCHTTAMPVGFVGPINNSRSPASASMRHEATSWQQASTAWQATTTPIVSTECSQCHTNTSSFGAAQYHSNLVGSQPATCLSCHANSRPTVAVGTPPYSHSANGGMGDCKQCHNSTSVWTGGQFPHTGVTSCNACHNSQRPTSTAGWVTAGWSQTSTTFSLTTHGGTNDCYVCHSSTTTFNSPANWAGGHKNHSPRPLECTSCHIPPIGIVGAQNFNHQDVGTQDCAGCHTTNANYTSLNGWAGASATPAGLVNADTTIFPWASVSVSQSQLTWNTNMANYSLTALANVKLPLQMLHTSPAVSASGVTLSNCAACHTVGITAKSGTQFHGSLTRLGRPQPTVNCSSCHLPGAVPSGIAGPKSGSSDITINMDHSATLVTECSTCHSGTSVGSFKQNAEFHSKVSPASVTSCKQCHIAKTPNTVLVTPTVYTSAGNSYPQHFVHKTSQVTQDCLTCHTQKGPGPVNPWMTTLKIHTVIAATSFTSCSDCHGQTGALDRPNTTTWYPSSTANNRYLHTSTYGGLGDCFKCHTKRQTSPYTDFTKVGITWNSGFYNHLEVKTRDKTATCQNCHTPTTGGYFNHNENTVGLKNQLKSPCMTCHGAAPAF